ncbi:MAG: formate dehydrogenase subunit gamma [Rhodobacteraceae bacterium]|nr:formate dehydrogenase subunit gamma [Paracoccaceae bacterium]
MTRVLARLRLLVVLIALAFVGGMAELSAQTAASPDGPTAGAVPGNTTAGSSADSDLWRAVRQGDTFTSAKQDPLAGQLIQAEGHGWELTRNGPLAMYTAWALTGILILLSLFYALRGRVRIDAGPCGQTITRFGLLERASHWLLASTFIVLGLTGLNLLLGRTVLLPLIGHEAFAVMAMYGKYIHNYVGFAFTASVVIVFLLWVRYNIPNFLDLKWIVRGGGLFGGGHPPARKFNAGQKLIFWTVVIGGGSLFASGWALMNPFETSMMGATFEKANAWLGLSLATDISPIQEQQYQQIWHTAVSVVMMVIIISHIYIGSIGMEGAVDAMTTGEVDLNWAKEHHSLWVEEHLEDVHSKSADGKRPTATPAE